SEFQPYMRDPETLARPWVKPGTPGLEHRIGGLEKQDVSGEVDQDPENHGRMVQLRAEKIQRVQREIPPLTIEGDESAELLLVGWGSSYGAITRAIMNQNEAGNPVAGIHLKSLSPLPADLGGILKRFRRVVIVENNSGQLWTKLRAEYLVDADRLNKVQGTPFKISEVEEKIKQSLGP
ncbi:MAG: 2-oxoglutarate ferredoxin oxidoreductase subunit alpha, partial [Candidatus Zixiibacteriota bacterium]